MVYRRCPLKKTGFTGSGKKEARVSKRPSLPTDEDGKIKLPFRRLDEPALSWKGDLASLEKKLASPEEVKRRQRELELILANPEYRELAIRQLEVGLETVRRWAKSDPQKFNRRSNQFVIERILAGLHLWAKLMANKSEWPELFQVISEYHHLRKSTACLRMCFIRHPTEISEA